MGEVLYPEYDAKDVNFYVIGRFKLTPENDVNSRKLLAVDRTGRHLFVGCRNELHVVPFDSLTTQTNINTEVVNNIVENIDGKFVVQLGSASCVANYLSITNNGTGNKLAVSVVDTTTSMLFVQFFDLPSLYSQGEKATCFVKFNTAVDGPHVMVKQIDWHPELSNNVAAVVLTSGLFILLHVGDCDKPSLSILTQYKDRQISYVSWSPKGKQIVLSFEDSQASGGHFAQFKLAIQADNIQSAIPFAEARKFTLSGEFSSLKVSRILWISTFNFMLLCQSPNASWTVLIVQVPGPKTPDQPMKIMNFENPITSFVENEDLAFEAIGNNAVFLFVASSIYSASIFADGDVSDLTKWKIQEFNEETSPLFDLSGGVTSINYLKGDSKQFKFFAKGLESRDKKCNYFFGYSNNGQLILFLQIFASPESEYFQVPDVQVNIPPRVKQSLPQSVAAPVPRKPVQVQPTINVPVTESPKPQPQVLPKQITTVKPQAPQETKPVQAVPVPTQNYGKAAAQMIAQFQSFADKHFDSFRQQIAMNKAQIAEIQKFINQCQKICIENQEFTKLSEDLVLQNQNLIFEHSFMNIINKVEEINSIVSGKSNSIQSEKSVQLNSNWYFISFAEKISQLSQEMANVEKKLETDWTAFTQPEKKSLLFKQSFDKTSERAQKLRSQLIAFARAQAASNKKDKPDSSNQLADKLRLCSVSDVVTVGRIEYDKQQKIKKFFANFKNAPCVQHKSLPDQVKVINGVDVVHKPQSLAEINRQKQNLLTQKLNQSLETPKKVEIVAQPKPVSSISAFGKTSSSGGLFGTTSQATPLKDSSVSASFTLPFKPTLTTGQPLTSTPTAKSNNVNSAPKSSENSVLKNILSSSSQSATVNASKQPTASSLPFSFAPTGSSASLGFGKPAQTSNAASGDAKPASAFSFAKAGETTPATGLFGKPSQPFSFAKASESAEKTGTSSEATTSNSLFGKSAQPFSFSTAANSATLKPLGTKDSTDGSCLGKPSVPTEIKPASEDLSRTASNQSKTESPLQPASTSIFGKPAQPLLKAVEKPATEAPTTVSEKPVASTGTFGTIQATSNLSKADSSAQPTSTPMFGKPAQSFSFLKAAEKPAEGASTVSAQASVPEKPFEGVGAFSFSKAAATSQAPSSTSSLFGNQNTGTLSSNTPAENSAKPSPFGGTNSLFGATTATNGGGSLFGSNTTTPATGGFSFLNAASNTGNSSSSLDQNKPLAPVAPTGVASPQPAAQSSLFGSNNVVSGFGNFNICQPSTPVKNQQQPLANPFGGANNFSSPTPAVTNSAPNAFNAFGQANNNNATTSFFGGAGAETRNNSFSNASGSFFSSPQNNSLGGFGGKPEFSSPSAGAFGSTGFGSKATFASPTSFGSTFGSMMPLNNNNAPAPTAPVAAQSSLFGASFSSGNQSNQLSFSSFDGGASNQTIAPPGSFSTEAFSGRRK